MAGLDVRPPDSQESPLSVVNAVKKMIPTRVHSNMQVGSHHGLGFKGIGGGVQGQNSRFSQLKHML